MLCIDRAAGTISESTFSALAEKLRADDLLVFNNSRVIPARLRGTIGTGGAACEVLLLRAVSETRWLAIGRPLRKFSGGVILEFDSEVRAAVIERVGTQEVLLDFSPSKGGALERAALERVGLMPIPPYIRGGLSDDKDREDYQSRFAAHDGSVAAPTASLHFTASLLDALKKKGIECEEVTLHVGTASFLPLWNEGEGESELKKPGRERYLFGGDAQRRIFEAKRAGRRVIAVGTTVARALESIAQQGELPRQGEWRESELFIEPGFRFAAIDGLITNFHQPRTTHLLLVQAIMGRELLERSYSYALQNGLRFLSYGDGMLIV